MLLCYFDILVVVKSEAGANMKYKNVHLWYTISSHFTSKLGRLSLNCLFGKPWYCGEKAKGSSYINDAFTHYLGKEQDGDSFDYLTGPEQESWHSWTSNVVKLSEAVPSYFFPHFENILL